MRISLEGKSAFVTGAGRAIGKSIALALGEASAHVYCAYQVDADSAAKSAEEIIQAGGSARPIQVDVESVDSIRAAANEIHDAGGSVDILVNNAAIRPRRKIEDVTVEEWDMVHRTNLRGPFFLAQAFLGDMKGKGWGRIINISGLDAYRGSSQRSHATSSKLGIVGLSRALAAEIALTGVTVNTVVPGITNTERRHPEWSDDIKTIEREGIKDIPLARLGEPEEIASAVVFIASPQASYITGQELLVTGGAHPLVRQRAREEA